MDSYLEPTTVQFQHSSLKRIQGSKDVFSKKTFQLNQPGEQGGQLKPSKAHYTMRVPLLHSKSCGKGKQPFFHCASLTHG